jgi:hypothetical protein
MKNGSAHCQCARPRLKDDSKLFRHKPLKRLPHPLYSHDISPSDFCLFGKVKSTLVGQRIPDHIDFLEAVAEILNGISDTELQCGCRSWIEHVERVIDAGSDHLT